MARKKTKTGRKAAAGKRAAAKPKRRVKPKLVNASSETSFWTRDGRILFNLRDLRDALKTISKESFIYHVNKEKNDFSKWIEDVLLDSRLAKALKKVKTRRAFLKKIEAALKKYR